VVGRKRPADDPHYKDQAKAMAEGRFTETELARSFFGRCVVCDQVGHEWVDCGFLEARVLEWENILAPTNTTSRRGGGNSNRGNRGGR